VEALVAAPVAWFENPLLDAPTPLTVEDDGRVYGHLAAFGSCHTGYPGMCITPPRGGSYDYFNAGEFVTDDGQRVGVGQITLGTGHAGLHLRADAAKAHYDDTGTCAVDVHVGEDEHGIWVAGAAREIPKERLRDLMAAKISGDWRSIKGRLELIGALAVNVPGFPIPRTQARVAAVSLAAAATMDEPRLALVASGIVLRAGVSQTPEEYQRKIRVLAARAWGIQGLAELATATR
jgi:hypothetical protein